jgi:hypothetical protein
VPKSLSECAGNIVTPAKAGVQERWHNLDSCLRRNDDQNAHARELSGFFLSDRKAGIVSGNDHKTCYLFRPRFIFQF